MSKTKVKAYGAKASDAALEELQIKRRDLEPNDVKIRIDYCGVCHSDIHTVRNDWGGSQYPVIPGHEIIGTVEAIGGEVSGFKVGQTVGVGCMVDSCRKCPSCREDLEQYCEEGLVGTYNGKDEHLGGHTYGGYSQQIVVDEHFVLNIPENLDLKATAPLLCAGITTWSPLSHWKIKEGDKVGVIGLGGLGHMGIKFANALGAHVVMITRSEDKAQDAKDLGAHDVLISTDDKQMKEHANSFDFLLNTIPVKHDMNPYLGLLKRDKTMVLVGAIEPLEPLHGASLVLSRKRVAGSLIGGIKETQEMLDFCGKHNITCDVEMIDMQKINEAYERVTSSDVKYRFVIDMDSLN
ncbi:NAD(P)-dependent alcohol dehydrogenase [Mesohalobacter halotolerans]|uniref:NAD(P)-dependent alcohol dehydrogenase n=1 Tax=Mesohalobacter halotolerans TaxID=1883405 RepID=A0A4U5TP25_9FLAO|nr:NAD(P)-dependent alcohol dehydrogenase [Mesohalobacter halotolerans]TKS55817.1 NAD(P)-dependent alcohol dehydrogenase [Mesohalobacter halotolerans]